MEVAEENKKGKGSNDADKKRKNYFGEDDQESHSLPQNNNHLFEDQKKQDIFDTSKDRIKK